MIELRAVGRRFGAFALQGIDLRIERGRYAVVLGPSGSGKTLLLKLIAGLLRPESGSVHIDGRDVTTWPPERRRLGLVFQEPSLFPHLGVRANIGYGLMDLARAEREQRIDELCAALGLGGLLARPTASLSGGEAQRVALARALAVRPRVLLLDEPLSALDHNARLELRAELGRLHRSLELTVLHVTHDREEARALGQDCAVLLDGRLAHSGTLTEVFARPDDPAVARFLGACGETG